MSQYKTISNTEIVCNLEKRYDVKVVFRALSNQASTMYVQNPRKGVIVVDKKIRGKYDDQRFTRLMLHEIGHILDYRERGAVKFYWDAIISFPTKMKLDKVSNRVKKVELYHDTPIERRANEKFNLQF